MDTSSIFKPYKTYNAVRGDGQTVIKNSIGRQLPYIVNFERNTCQIFDVELETVTHSYSFPSGCTIISIDHFPDTTGKFGIIVGVEDKCQTWGSEHFVTALSAAKDSPKMLITGMIEVPERITIVKTIFSNVDMAEGMKNQSLGLFPRLLEWPHIVAIGCKRTKCYLTSLLKPSTDDSTFQVPKKNKMLELMGAFVSNGVFNYACDDGAFREYPVDGVYVSAIALMPRSRTLLVGLSMGGILAAALNSSNQMNLLELRHERLINDIAPLEPEDDPDKYEYFIAAVDRSPRHNIMIQLFRGSFKSMDEMKDEEKYDHVLFNVCLEHKILLGERWLSVKTIVTERGTVDGWSLRRRNDSSMDSMILNVSQNFGCTSNRSNVFLAYERRADDSSPTEPAKFIVEASIFDIDAWYYKRVPGKVTLDGTVLRQSQFMSRIRSNISSDQVTDIALLTSDSTSLTRFSSMISDADQLFYPSSMSYSRVYVTERDKISWMNIQSIQETILEKCASKLPWVVRSPESMAASIIASGLIGKSVLTGSPNTSASEIVDDDHSLPTDLRVVLNAMMYYGKIEEFTGLINRSDLSDKIKTDIANWAFFEAVDYKRLISDRTVSLFHGVTAALSPLAEDTVNQGIKLFRIVHEYIRSCSQSMKETGNLRKLALSAKCMLSHTKLVSRFINVNIVPVNHLIQNTMRQMHEKRKNVALKNRSVLPVQMNVRNMHRLTSEARFWNELPYEDWYPPTPLDLLESILNISIPERVKREVVIQYVIDWLRANQTEISEKDIAREVINVMTSQMLGVDFEKIYVVMDEEKNAFKQTITVESAEEKARKKVFSTDEEGLTYEQLWNGEIHLTATFKSSDMERFKQRMIAAEDKGKKLAVLDPESEKLYQVFLYENRRFDMMSNEAVESHPLLSQFAPRPMKKITQSDSMSAKEKEIQRSVREMFEKHQKKKEQEVPDMFATIEKSNGRKRRSEVNEPSTSPVVFVPPTAKRIQHHTEESVKAPESSAPDTSMNDTLNHMIATPARYYKRPIEPIDMRSPTEHQKLPPVPKQTSILKTAKPSQSPSRGRIRFHASVRKGPNESIESIGEDRNGNVGEQTEAIKQINFAILGDVEEDDVLTVRRSRSNSKAQEAENVPEQEDPFEVLEEVEEETFELQEDAEEGAKVNREPIEEVVEDQALVEPTVQSEERMEEVPVGATVQNEQPEEIYEDPVNEIEDVAQVEVQVETQEMEYEEAQWDGVERSFELQKDEDCLRSEAPKESDSVGEESAQMDVDDTIAIDVALNRTFEAQEEEEPQPLGDAEISESPKTFIVKAKEPATMNEDALDMERPPSANTRSRARALSSRPATPVENLSNEVTKKSEAKSDTAVVDAKPEETTTAPKKIVRRTRSSSRRCSPRPEEEEQEGPSTSRTRSETVKDDVVVDKPEAKEKKKPKTVATPRAPSVTRKRLTSKPIEQEEGETSTVTTGRMTRSRANSRSQTPARTLDEATTTEDEPACPERNTTPTEAEENKKFDVNGSALLKRVSRRISSRATSVVPETSTPAVSTKKSTRASASAPTTPRRGRQKSESEKPEAKPKGPAKRAVVPVDTPREEPAKKTRGLARTTPLRAIPENGEVEQEQITATPKRGRSRNNSTSSTAPATSSSAPSTPKRGRKPTLAAPTLDNVAEEQVPEPATATRRSARRLQQHQQQ